MHTDVAQAVSLQQDSPTKTCQVGGRSSPGLPDGVTRPPDKSRPLAFYGLVVLAGWLANAWRWEAVYLLVAACLLLPLLDRSRTGLARALTWRREGWGWALALSTLATVGVVLFFAGTRAWQGAALQTPAESSLWAFAAGQLALWLPLAVAEEFFFRGYLQETVGASLWGERRIGRGRLAVSVKSFVAALLFGLAHALAWESVGGLWTLFSGLLLGVLVERSRGSLWPATLLHAGLNVGGALLWLLLELNYPLIAGWLM